MIVTNRGRGSMVRSLSYTEVSTALTCQAQHAFGYTGRLTGGDTLRRKAIAPILSDGRAWGAAVAVWHATDPLEALVGGDVLAPAWRAHAALRASYAADRVAQEEAGVFVDVGEHHARVDRVAAILDHYMATAVRLPRVDRLEHEIVVPLPSRSGRRSSSRYRFLARLDAVSVDRGREWLVEYKLRAQLTPGELVPLGRQIRWYAWARQQQTGVSVVGVILDERLNEAPKAARVIQAGKENPQVYACPACGAVAGECCQGQRGPLKVNHPERAKLAGVVFGPSHDTAQVTTPENYRAVCEEFGEEPHQDVLEALAAREWQQRFVIPFRPSELEESGRELVSAAKLVRDLDAGELYPVRNAQPRLCKSCRFRPVCANPGDRLFVDTLFDRREPKRLRDSNQEVVA